MRLLKFASVVAFSIVAACSSPPDEDHQHPPPPMPQENPLITARPYEHKVPSSYDAKKPTALVVLLHGFGASGLTQELLFGFTEIAERFGFLYAMPDGTINSQGKRFWNATEVCCDLEGKGVDDVAYIDAVISDMAARYNVDPQRIYLVGHSNGGFMSLRFACDRAERVAALVSLAGAAYKDATKCQPKSPVAVLQVHGDMDALVPYGGAMMGGFALPSAEETVAGWAQKNGCAAALDRTPPSLDLESNLTGAETTVACHPGCKAGGAAELWTIVGGSHVPTFNRPTWGEAVWGFFAAHPKPNP
jgi:polyhydroxybutyrate depolymerase